MVGIEQAFEAMQGQPVTGGKRLFAQRSRQGMQFRSFPARRARAASRSRNSNQS